MTKKNIKVINGEGAGASVPQVVPNIDKLIRERNNIHTIINELTNQMEHKKRIREYLIQRSQSPELIDGVIKNLRKQRRIHKNEFNRIQRQIFRLQNPTINDEEEYEEEEYEEEEIRNAENAEEGTGFRKNKTSKWIDHVKAHSKEHNISYKEALKSAKESYNK